MSESTPSQQQPEEEEHTAAAPPCSYSYNTEYLNVPGVRFVPTDVELIAYFLRPKLHGQEVFPADVVHEKEVYHKHPSELVRELGESLEGSWYCFSTRNRKYRNGKRPSRNTGDDAGFWKAMSKIEDVVDEENQVVIGQKRALTYHDFVYEYDLQAASAAGPSPMAEPRRKKKKEHCKKTEWKMVEFVSADSDKPIHTVSKSTETTADNSIDYMLLNEWVLCKITRKVEQGKEKEPSRPCPSQSSGYHVEPDPISSPLLVDPRLLDDAGNPDLLDELATLHSSFGLGGE